MEKEVSFPSHLKKLCSIYWYFDLKSWIVDSFTREKTPQNNFSGQNFSVENNYWFKSLQKFKKMCKKQQKKKKDYDEKIFLRNSFFKSLSKTKIYKPIL